MRVSLKPESFTLLKPSGKLNYVLLLLSLLRRELVSFIEGFKWVKQLGLTMHCAVENTIQVDCF